jgi:hypothetical protein
MNLTTEELQIILNALLDYNDDRNYTLDKDTVQELIEKIGYHLVDLKYGNLTERKI